VLSIIIPTLNEAAHIESTLAVLMPLQDRGAEVIVADGGSDDETLIMATRLANQVLMAPRGRAAQLNAGAHAARGDVLFFVHADSLPPHDADQIILDALNEKRCWGRFDVRISGASAALPVVAAMMNLRSRLTGIATGDQGLFMTRQAFDAVGGFPALPLMEDIAMSRALKHLARPICLREKMLTSGRRWDKHGVINTILLMWRLRTAYFFGADPALLARRYHGHNG
jgi:rSAM/selenodomain-associated transferase 2